MTKPDTVVLIHNGYNVVPQRVTQTFVKENVKELVEKLVKIFNGRLKIDRLYYGK